MKKPTNGRRLVQIADFAEALIEARDRARPRSTFDIADDLGLPRGTAKDWMRVLAAAGRAVPARTIETGPKNHPTVLWRWNLVGREESGGSPTRHPI